MLNPNLQQLKHSTTKLPSAMRFAGIATSTRCLVRARPQSVWKRRCATVITTTSPRHYSPRYYTTTTSTSTMRPQRPAFTDLVVKTIQARYPDWLAAKAWDNTGLLLDNTAGDPPLRPVVLLTNDLTTRVANEALALGASVVVSYHPIIFGGLKSLTLADTQQTTLLRLARAGVAVYCPHTAFDASPWGLGRWLGGSLTDEDGLVALQGVADARAQTDEFRGSGYGCRGTLDSPMGLDEVLRRLAARLGGPQTDDHKMMVARPRGGSHPATLDKVMIKTFAACAGSGADILASASDVDLWITGGISHHAALKAVEQGRVVVTVFHSNSERAFLRQRLQPWLERELKQAERDAVVVVSAEDEDPFWIVDVESAKEFGF